MNFTLTARFGDGEETIIAPTGRASSLDTATGAATIGVQVDDDELRTIVSNDHQWGDDLYLTATVSLDTVSPIARALYPLYQGIVEDHTDPSGASFEFRGPGWNTQPNDGRRLGIPAVIVQEGDEFILIGTDPGYSAHIAVNAAASSVVVSWAYRSEAGSHDQIARRIVSERVSTLEEALDAWFVRATPDVPAGPEWLHEIQWQHYDYMSKNGDGWFADIDAVCDIVAPVDRHRVAFTLHAWYDFCGRYCYDRETGQMDQSWTVFSHMADPRLLAREGEPEAGTQPPAYTFRNLRDYEPIPMNWDEVRRRIEYAKDRGFRVPFYLITGMMDIGSAAEHAQVGDGLDSGNVPLWIGPDVVSETYLANPLHPDVRERYLGLTKGVLDEVGDLIDALVIDEAYYIGYGQLGPKAYPGYADLGQATLLQEIAAVCHAYRPDIALLTADHMGTQYLLDQAFPYCLFADGIYHDAWNHAQPHEAARFPTWRNTVWSCSWAPASAIANTKWAVLAYDAPISTSNGCFGDDLNIVDMGAAQLETLRELWQIKRQRSFTQRPLVASAH